MMPSFDISPPATSSAKAARSDTDEESATGLTPGRVTPGGGLTDLSDGKLGAIYVLVHKDLIQY